MEPKLNIWIRYLLPLFLALFLGSLIWLMAQFREPPGFAWYGFAWFALTIYAIWEFGWRISRQLDRESPWSKGTFRRLMIQLTVMNLGGLFIFDGTFILLNWYENAVLHRNNPLALMHILVASAEAFIIVQISASIQIGIQLLSNWQQARVETEQLRKEKAVSSLEEIRRQIESGSFAGDLTEWEDGLAQTPGQAAAYLQRISETFDQHLRRLNGQLEGVQAALKDELPDGYPVRGYETESRYKTRFLVRSGTKFVVIPREQIAGFYKDEIVLLISRNGKKFPVDASLEELETRLSPLHFFRINRQCIVHIASVQEIRPDGSQLALTMEVDFPKALTVSQRNAGSFKRWLDGE